jgi:hypothetical protein
MYYINCYNEWDIIGILFQMIAVKSLFEINNLEFAYQISIRREHLWDSCKAIRGIISVRATQGR